MKTGIYVRVSTGLQAIDGYSLNSQEELCIEKAKQLNIDTEDLVVYREEGVSGEDIDRPQLNKLREDVSHGLIKNLICVHPDRLSRDLTDKLLVCRELQKYEVELVFVDTEFKNTPEGQLFFNMQSSIAQYELALIKKRTTRGRLEAVRKEKKVMPMRVAPYGYDLIDSKLVINEEEAIFVKRIYDWYINEKLTLREIGEKLYKLGAIPKRKESQNWSASSIRRVLSSPIYIGKYVYNKRKSKKIKGEKTASGYSKIERTERDSAEWIVIDVPSIIEENVFNQAQEQRMKNTKKSGNQKYNYLLKSILRCGHCGRIYQATTYTGRRNKETGEITKYPVYRCPNLFPKKYGPEVERCNSRSIRADLLENYIWALILDLLNSPNEIIEEYKDNYLGSIDEVEISIKLFEKNLSSKNNERERIKQLFVKGFITEEEVSKEFNRINKEISYLEFELKKYKEYRQECNRHMEDEQQFKQIITNVTQLLENHSSLLSFKEKRFILEHLIDEIGLKFETDLETVNVTVYGMAREFP